eukprot:TRINITY_DN34895_c0_g1_i2.p1 TRINITY_DN34895_c0_g1~~TRINITY_DN34895_c0_g1_i2.p1  ORF type:complete len:502 (+),score=90.32 TRINITY_DN34895_c0_g1_i2:196-1701(+)
MARKPPTAAELAAAQEGALLRHSSGLCVRPADETTQNEDDTVLLLISCDTPPKEQNIRAVVYEPPEESEDEWFRMKQGGRCAHPESDDDPDLAPSDPKLAFPADCNGNKHFFNFKKFPAKRDGMFVIRHQGGKCVHPFEGAEKPKENTELILHGDCDGGRLALSFKTEALGVYEKSSDSKKKKGKGKEKKDQELVDPTWQKCDYMKGSPQSSRPGKPCIPPAPFWPYSSKTPWKIELGSRVLAAVTPKITEEKCGGFYLYGDQTWCNKAFDGSHGRALVGLSYGIEERDIWSELISAKKYRTRLYDCYIPPANSPAIAGKAPNGTRQCNGVENKPCYSEKYEPYRICLGGEDTKDKGRKFERLHGHLVGLPKHSVHLKIDVEGSEWPVLDQLIKNAEDWDKIRTLDMEVHFWTGDALGKSKDWIDLSPQEKLEKEVGIMEGLLQRFHCTGSTLEVYRQGWNPKDSCEGSKCGEPPVYLPGGFSVEMFAVSYVHKELVGDVV